VATSIILFGSMAYLDHEKAGAGGFDDMGEHWVSVRDGARQHTLRLADKGVRDVASRWEQFVQYLALGLIAHSARLAILGVPSLKTVQNYVAEYESQVPPVEERRYWTLQDGDGDVVLPLLRYLKTQLSTEFVPMGRRLPAFGQVDQETASWYVRIVRAVPTIPVAEAWSLAIDYRWEGYPAAEIDEYFAFTPWVDGGEAYVTAAEEGRLLVEVPIETPSTRDRIEESPLDRRWKTRLVEEIREAEEPEPKETLAERVAAMVARIEAEEKPR
jgi:hypothetical protein